MLYHQTRVELKVNRYNHSGRWAISLVETETGEPVGSVTVNLPDEPLGEDELFVKDYSENEGMLAWLETQELVEDTGRRVQSGYVSIPVVRILPRLREILNAC